MSYANLKCPFCCVCDRYIDDVVFVECRGDVLFLFHEECFKEHKREPRFGDVLDIDGTLD